MADAIYINTQRTASVAVVKSENRPNQPAALPSFVEGAVKDVELYFVTNDGTFDARSGDVGTSVKVSIGRRDATPNDGTFTLADSGAATTSAITYGASAQTIEDALNALNAGTGADSILVDVTKQSDTLYLVIGRTNGAMSALTGASVDLSPESSVTPSVVIDGDADTRAQQIIEVQRQPAIYTSAWTAITDGFSGSLSANNARVAQSLQSRDNQPFIFEVSIDGDVVCQVPCEVKPAITPPAAYPADPMPTALGEHLSDYTNPHQVTSTQVGVQTYYGGGVVGGDAYAFSGGAVGYSASANTGGSVGYSASATSGGAVGHSASASSGGAVGYNASATDGFAGGASAQASGTSRVQLGGGINATNYTIQFLDSGSITAAEFGRLKGTFGDLYSQGGADVAISDGGTGASTAALARNNLGFISASATLDFPSISANSDEELTINVNGASVGDAVQLAAPTSIERNLLWSGYVSDPNTVTVRLSNIDGGSINPASAIWGCIVTPLS